MEDIEWGETAGVSFFLKGAVGDRRRFQTEVLDLFPNGWSPTTAGEDQTQYEGQLPRALIDPVGVLMKAAGEAYNVQVMAFLPSS